MTAPLPAADDPAFVPDATVVVAGLSMWFGQKVAVTELSCSFGPGVTGLLGPNGAGKTTLMRALVGLLPPNRGEVYVNGQPGRPLVRRPGRPRLRHRRPALAPARASARSADRTFPKP